MLPPNERITPTIIVTIGRGGTGKTSFVALMAKCFIEEKETPLLLVDIDPDQSLAEMVGVDLEKAQKKTIAELLTETFLEEGGTTVGVSPTERIESKIWEKSLFEGDTFDLLAVGTKWVEGCYCLPDAALKNALGSIIKQYRYILIDSPAGLEHLNRRVVTKVYEIFDVVGPSKKSLDNVRRAYRIAREVNITFERFSIVGGFMCAKEHVDCKSTIEGVGYMGAIADDNQISRCVLEGKSLLDLPSESRGYQSVRQIMKQAGYVR